MKENYNFNSHSSIAYYYNILSSNEDLWNKWEYNLETKTLIKFENNQRNTHHQGGTEANDSDHDEQEEEGRIAGEEEPWKSTR